MSKIMNSFTDTVFLTEEDQWKKNDIKCFPNKITMELSDVLSVLYNERVPSLKKKLWMLNEKTSIHDTPLCIFKTT